MDIIVLSLDKELDEQYVDDLASLIDEHFYVIEDDNSCELLSFVIIDAQHVNIEFNDISVVLQDTLKPHKHVSIPNKYLFNVKVKL